MGIIPVSLDDNTIKKIDLLIKNGIYKNRSEALRDQIKKGLENLDPIGYSFASEEQKTLYSEVLDQLLKLKTPPFILKTEKSITELVSEGRER